MLHNAVIYGRGGDFFFFCLKTIFITGKLIADFIRLAKQGQVLCPERDSFSMSLADPGSSLDFPKHPTAT